MLYSEVVSSKLLPKKEKYTKRDVDRVILNSLFNGPKTYSTRQAKFIVVCSSIYHETKCSEYVYKREESPQCIVN